MGDPGTVGNTTHVYGTLVDRRRGERRRPDADTRLAPHGRERRQGDRRRQATALLSAAVLVAGVATPAPSAELTAAAANPLAGVRLYVDPNSNAKRTADAWRSTRPADAAQMDKIAGSAQADWFGNWNTDLLGSVDRRVTRAAAAGAVPVLVAYNIPNRDCSGGYSAGGAADGAGYRDWIRRFALGIGSRRAVVILEPDALAQLGKCGTEAQQQDRLNNLWDAVQVLKGNPATAVYIDAGHSTWLSADVAAARLNAAGVAGADGFSLNVSNFNPTANEVAYGKKVSAKLGGKHFVVDTSRNGVGPSTTWCNPPGEGLGLKPSSNTADGNVDAYLWVKRPGESDGTCNGGPSAGTFWADYALGLAKRATF
jgi:endoglucanase